MDFLLNDGKKIECLELIHAYIYDEIGTLVSCDKSFAKVPNVTKFHYSSQKEIFTNETFQNMSELSTKVNTKLTDFKISIYQLSDEANIKLLCNIIPKNFNENSKYVFDMRMTYSLLCRLSLKAVIESMLLSCWKPRTIKPRIYVK